jgi:chromosomal replication initiation ATPase DnaA
MKKELKQVLYQFKTKKLLIKKILKLTLSDWPSKISKMPAASRNRQVKTYRQLVMATVMGKNGSEQGCVWRMHG